MNILDSTSIVSIIACMSMTGAIGNSKTNQMPWPRNKEDMDFFRSKTLNHPVIMGRNTFQSIGQPLKDRFNIVITRNEEAQGIRPQSKFGPIFVGDIIQAIDMCADLTNEIFIIGGRAIYDEYIKNELVDRMYLNVLKTPYEGDVEFPYYNKNDWLITESETKYETLNSYTLIKKAQV